MRDSLQIMKDKELGICNIFQQDKGMKETGNKTIKTVLEYFITLMVIDMKVIGFKTRDKGKELSIFQMALFIKEILLMILFKEKEL